MATCSLGDVYQDVRGYLADTGYLGSIPSGEQFVNAVLPVFFSEPYRTMFGRLQGSSKRVQRVLYVTLPVNTTVLIPSTFGVTDFAEPEMVEERPSVGGAVITSTSATTPIRATIPSHGLGPVGSMVAGQISGVLGTSAPWGNWYVTVIDANTVSLNGSASDGSAGTGGTFYPQSSQSFTEVVSIDLSAVGLDGPPQSVLGTYLWINEMLQFRGASQPTQLRITYYASGNPPTNPNTVLGIDNCRDFLAKATAANAAASVGWTSRAQELKMEAYGDPALGDPGGLLLVFMNIQVLASQHDHGRRLQAFRDKRYRWGSYILG